MFLPVLYWEAPYRFQTRLFLLSSNFQSSRPSNPCIVGGRWTRAVIPSPGVLVLPDASSDNWALRALSTLSADQETVSTQEQRKLSQILALGSSISDMMGISKDSNREL